MDLISVVGVNANAPVFVRYWDVKSSTRSGFSKISGILLRGRQPKEFADPVETVCACALWASCLVQTLK